MYKMLTGGSYKTRTLPAAAQRCLNLYIERTPQAQGEPSPNAHNCTPGLVLLSVAPQERIRCLYRSTNGSLYGCAGQDVYSIDSSWVWHQIGHFQPSSPTDAVPRTTPVSMVDNGTDMIVCDGTVDGWTFKILTNTGWTRITDPGWYGSTRIEYQDTFFIANKPATPIFYCSGSVDVTWDALDFASKVSYGDPLQVVVSLTRNLWLIGKFSTEVFYNSGGGGSGSNIDSTFPFETTSSYHEFGTVSPYSVARISDTLLWLAQDASGVGMIMQASGYNLKRISNHSIETEFNGYTRLDDAVAYVYQQDGHQFYCLNFPTADKTWVYDLVTEEFHERAWIDDNGHEHRHRGNCAAFAYNTNVVGDWELGNLYKFDLNTFTDTIVSGSPGPIKRLRSFPHFIDQTMNRRVFYKALLANMAVGTATDAEGPSTLIHSTFTAPSGTLLEDYSNNTDSNASFTLVTGSGEVLDNEFTAVTSSGRTAYAVKTVPVTPDYTISFSVIPSSYTAVPSIGSDIWVIGRAVSNQGYQAGIVTNNGTSYQAFLTVGTGTAHLVEAGVLASGSYVVTLEMVAAAIRVTVHRSPDGMWLGSDGVWVGNAVTAISITDSTYTTAGQVLIGGDWLS